MRLALLLLALIPLAVAPPVPAAQVEDLFAAEVPLPVRDRDAVDQAFAEALSRVLLRVTGRRELAEDPALDPLRARARALVRQWSYTRQGLWAEFDAGLLVGELRDLGLPVWGADRPLVLVWLAVDDDLGPAWILGSEDPVASAEAPAGGEADDAEAHDLPWGSVAPWDSLDPGSAEELLPAGPDRAALREALSEVAALRGLPLRLPGMDTDEREEILVESLCGSGFGLIDPQRDFGAGDVDPDAPWRVAAQRYRADAVLVGCGRWLGDRMLVDWTLQLGDREADRRRWRGDLAEGPHGATDVLSRALAATGRAAGRFRLQVQGIDSLADYGRVMRHLEGLSVIERVMVERASDGILHLSVDSRADEAQLRRALLIGRTLEALPGEGRYAVSR